MNVFNQLFEKADAALKGVNLDILGKLSKGRLHLTQDVLKHSASQALQESKVRLLDLSALADSVEMRLDVSKAGGTISVREAVIRVSVHSIAISDISQEVEVKLLATTLYSDQLVGRVAIWFARTFLKRKLHSMVQSAAVAAISSGCVNVTEKPETGTLIVDLSNIPSVKSVASVRPVPLVSKSLLGLLNITSVEHCSGGIEIVCSPLL